MPFQLFLRDFTMRATTLTVLLIGLWTSPAWAIVGGHGHNGGGNNNTKYARLDITNSSDGPVSVSVNGSTPSTLEPLATSELLFTASKGNKVEVTVTATIPGTAISTTKTATIQVGKTATATITSPSSTSLAITLSGPGLLAANTKRESAVVLASTGGLLPLLWLGFLLGGRPRRRESHEG
jgi:hypothetical protein